MRSALLLFIYNVDIGSQSHWIQMKYEKAAAAGKTRFSSGVGWQAGQRKLLAMTPTKQGNLKIRLDKVWWRGDENKQSENRDADPLLRIWLWRCSCVSLSHISLPHFFPSSK